MKAQRKMQVLGKVISDVKAIKICKTEWRNGGRRGP
jgi:hypothetical protein